MLPDLLHQPTNHPKTSPHSALLLLCCGFCHASATHHSNTPNSLSPTTNQQAALAQSQAETAAANDAVIAVTARHMSETAVLKAVHNEEIAQAGARFEAAQQAHGAEMADAQKQLSEAQQQIAAQAQVMDSMAAVQAKLSADKTAVLADNAALTADKAAQAQQIEALLADKASLLAQLAESQAEAKQLQAEAAAAVSAKAVPAAAAAETTDSAAPLLLAPVKTSGPNDDEVSYAASGAAVAVELCGTESAAESPRTPVLLLSAGVAAAGSSSAAAEVSCCWVLSECG